MNKKERREYMREYQRNRKKKDKNYKNKVNEYARNYYTKRKLESMKPIIKTGKRKGKQVITVVITV